MIKYKKYSVIVALSLIGISLSIIIKGLTIKNIFEIKSKAIGEDLVSRDPRSPNSSLTNSKKILSGSLYMGTLSSSISPETKIRNYGNALEPRNSDIKRLDAIGQSVQMNELSGLSSENTTVNAHDSSTIPDEGTIATLKMAIRDLIKTYGNSYPKGETFLTELDKQFSLYNNTKDKKEKAEALLAIYSIRKEALLTNPAVCKSPILFVVRHQHAKDHGSTHTVYNTGKYDFNGEHGAGPSRPDRTIPGGAIKMIDLNNGGKLTTIIETKEGFIRDPVIHWNGRKILFSWKQNPNDNHHIYEINIDGTGLRQLTFLKDVDDINPLYLPDERIVFSSDRELKYVPCNRHRMFNLYRMNPDGSNIHQITKNTGYDKASSITPDGRILFDRYYYIDRDSHNVNSLWTVNPDGTNQDQFWGNHTETPDIVVQGRIIPESQQTIAIFGSAHDRPRGILALIDKRLGIDGPGPVIRTWPPEVVNLVVGETTNNNATVITRYVTGYISTLQSGIYYQDPYPLSDKYFLVSRMTMSSNPPVESIYLVDIFGNEILVHKEYPGCFAPMSVSQQVRPLVRPDLRNFENNDGYFYVEDVYEGLTGIKRGTIKSIRVVESPEKRYWASGTLAWFNYSTTYPGISWHSFETKRILGTIPIEEDGSAYFEVPTDKFVYFQLLDENGMMIQSMRSGTVVQSGETKGCVGCHDNRVRTPLNRGNALLMALKKPPQRLRDWYGESREFNYAAEVQPVFDKHCVQCHNFGTKAGQKLNLARDRNVIFNTSYNELWRKNYIVVTGAGPCKVPEPKSWGSHASPLVKTLLKGHQDVNLSKEEFDRIVTWIDLNGIFYGSFASAFPENRGGRSPLNPSEEDRLGALTGVDMAKQYYHNLNEGPLISFDRPDISPILSRLDKNDVKYKEALSIIEKGKERIKVNPTSDMPGFKIRDDANIWHENMYQYLRWIELRNRAAIRNNGKLYDTDQPSFDSWLEERTLAVK